MAINVIKIHIVYYGYKIWARFVAFVVHLNVNFDIHVSTNLTTAIHMWKDVHKTALLRHLKSALSLIGHGRDILRTL